MNRLSHRCITDLDTLAAALPRADRARFERIFDLRVTTGALVPPEAMHPWIEGYFGSVKAVRRQRIVKVTNKVTLEGALFNAVRARRPIEAPAASESAAATIASRHDCSFCRPLEGTPADTIGRVRGTAALTASNIAKYDGWHSLVVFDEHDPLRFSAEQVADYVDTAQKWAQAAHQADPEARYPFFLWNCLWRSGASILHGHAQMTLTRGMHYARVEAWRQAAWRYQASHDTNYFADLVTVHGALGLAVKHGTATILTSLTPVKEKETQIISWQLDDDLKAALYRVLSTFVHEMGVQSFNLSLYQPPLAQTPEDWDGFPLVFRILDRGRLDARTSDVGAMEFFAQSVITTDPYHVADALRGGGSP